MPGADNRPRLDRTPLPSISQFQTLKTPDVKWRVGILRNRNMTIIAAMDMNSFYEEINRFRNAFLVAGSLGLLLLGGAGWFLAGRAMKPISVIAETAEGITARGLNQRIPQVGTDAEIEHLVTVANHMLDRLEKSYHQAVRFSADAAHELQTPLAILQGELDNAIHSAENGSAEQQHYSMLLEELRNLKSVVHKLLLLSHADEGRLNLNLSPVNLSELLEEAAEDIQLMAPGLAVDLLVPERLMVAADQTLLNQAIRNMTSNAAKYTTENGKVVFRLAVQDQTVLFTLSNTAPPIPEEDRPLLFERFHRVEKSRTTSGSGLGLSLAREIARAHGGDLVLNPCSDEMVSFTLSLPVDAGKTGPA
jgi:signal transduction histidine kinase